MFFYKKKSNKGFSLVEVLVVVAISALIFVGLFAAFEYSLKLIAQSRAKMTALSVVNDQMEYIRSLAYDSVGTVSGIPPGPLLQTSTTTLNDMEFTKRILVEYVDDDADGIGAADTNGITTDYKQVKVVVSWNIYGVNNEIFLVSNITPRSIETNVGGGTLRVNVFDADIQPLPGASVRVINNTIAPNIDVTRFTDATGVALFGGAPAGPDYEIFVNGAGYSNDQTYRATTTLPFPSTQPIAVLEADISTMSFFIDRTSQLNLRTLGARTSQVYAESFANTLGLATSSGIEVSGGSARLETSGSNYVDTGVLFLDPVTPAPLMNWEYLVAIGTMPFNTDVTFRLYSSTSTSDLLPDSALPGNGVGFTLGTIDISAVSTTTYPSLVVGVTLETADISVTPSIDEIQLYYLESETLQPNVNLNMRGSKTIGIDGVGGPVYKTINDVTTNSSGEYVFPDLEWDSYIFTPSSYDIAEACSSNPLDIRPDTDDTLSLVLAPDTASTLRVVAETMFGSKLIGAEIRLTRPSFSTTLTSSTCGQAFFSGLSSNNDYELRVSPAGYPEQTVPAINIAADEVIVVRF